MFGKNKNKDNKENESKEQLDDSKKAAEEKTSSKEEDSEKPQEEPAEEKAKVETVTIPVKEYERLKQYDGFIEKNARFLRTHGLIK